MVDKRFKISPKGEEFKWNLPSSVVDYGKFHFENYIIPDTDIDEKMFAQNFILKIVFPIRTSTKRYLCTIFFENYIPDTDINERY